MQLRQKPTIKSELEKVLNDMVDSRYAAENISYPSVINFESRYEFARLLIILKSYELAKLIVILKSYVVSLKEGEDSTLIFSKAKQLVFNYGESICYRLDFFFEAKVHEVYEILSKSLRKVNGPYENELAQKKPAIQFQLEKVLYDIVDPTFGQKRSSNNIDQNIDRDSGENPTYPGVINFESRYELAELIIILKSYIVSLNEGHDPALIFNKVKQLIFNHWKSIRDSFKLFPGTRVHKAYEALANSLCQINDVFEKELAQKLQGITFFNGNVEDVKISKMANLYQNLKNNIIIFRAQSKFLPKSEWREFMKILLRQIYIEAESRIILLMQQGKLKKTLSSDVDILAAGLLRNEFLEYMIKHVVKHEWDIFLYHIDSEVLQKIILNNNILRCKER